MELLQDLCSFMQADPAGLEHPIFTLSGLSPPVGVLPQQRQASGDDDSSDEDVVVPRHRPTTKSPRRCPPPQPAKSPIRL